MEIKRTINSLDKEIEKMICGGFPVFVFVALVILFYNCLEYVR